MKWYALHVAGLTTIVLFFALVVIETFTGYIEWYLPYRAWKQNARRRYVRGKRLRRQRQPRNVILRAMELVDEKDQRREFTWVRVSGDEDEMVEEIA
jgi:hypothetical protein